MFAALFVAALGAAALAAQAKAASAGAAKPPVAYPASLSAPGVVAWLGAHTTIAPSQVASLGDRYVLAMVSAQVKADLGRSEAVARMEALTPAFGAELGGRSAKLTLDVQCPTRRARLRRLQIYAEPNLKGVSNAVGQSGEWMDGSPGSYLGDVVSAACDPNFVRPFAALDQAHDGRARGSLLRDGRAWPSPTAKPPKGPAPILAPLLLSPPPQVLRPRLGSIAPTPPPSPPVHASKGGPMVQLAAADTRAGAEDVRRDFVTAHPAAAQGHLASIIAAQVGAKVFYRVLVSGFADAAAARAACAALRAGGDACFVRPPG